MRAWTRHLDTVTTRAMVGAVLMALCAGTWADPAPPYSSIAADPTAYNLTQTYLGQVAGTNPGQTWYCYQWDVTFNGSQLLDSQLPIDQQQLSAFAVYDGELQVSPWNQTYGWSFDATGPNALVQWTSANGSGLTGDQSASFSARFSGQLPTSSEPTAIWVTQDGGTSTALLTGSGGSGNWVSDDPPAPTPEVPVTWLLGLSAGLIGLLKLRRR